MKLILHLQDEAKEARCRMDWHQTSGSVIISVFSKCADPTKTIIKANSVCVSIFIVYEGDKIYSETIELNGVSYQFPNKQYVLCLTATPLTNPNYRYCNLLHNLNANSEICVFDLVI